MPLTLRTLTKTVFKQRPLQSSDLPDQEKYAIAIGQELAIDTFTKERNHIRFTLSNDPLSGFDTWYAFAEHVEVLSNGGSLNNQLYPKLKPRSIQLDIPYLSQLDNYENPTGSCNVTSVAMCLKYFRVPKRTNAAQLEDELYRYALNNNLSRHDPRDLVKVVEAYGCKDLFRTNATIEDVKDWLADLNPVITHGFFTTFGHIVVLVGYDDKGFYVHDPYGEWFPTGYRTDLPGAYLHYSYDLIKQVCLPDGNFWVHFV